MKRALTIAAILLSATAAYGQSRPISAGTVNASAVITLGNTFQTILAAGNRQSVTIQNNMVTTDNCWVFVGGGTATVAKSILLTPGMSYTRYYPFVPNDAIQATCASTNDTLYVDTN